jgi:hypothetical protein
MKPLPLPVRVAAGLAVTAVDRARHLPEKLAELPVTMVSQALQMSMRLQQQVTELAIKGDDALSSLRAVEESPEWATFDEDSESDRYDASPRTAAANGSLSAFDRIGDEPAADEPADEADKTEDKTEEATTEGDATAADPWAEEERALLEEVATEPDVPAALPHYPDLTLPQLRARLRRLDADQLTELLEFETAHAGRPEFVGMLTRRIATLRDQQ